VLPTSDKKKPVLPVYKDPMDSMKAWPAQPKRDNLPGCRTIIIKGVGDLKTVHQVQALVWGGPIESFHPAEIGKDFAMVKFMTAAGCRKYFDATENGIELPNTKKVVFVERQPGPNSVNDVLQNCIEGGVTRCVRALGADEDWSEMVLRKLAEGTDKKKRQLDFIKRGKTVRGVST
jgi:protein-S-isoprenylcysteine O-methyltransferase